MTEPLTVVVARVAPLAGFSAEQVDAAARIAAKREPEWRRDAEAIWPEDQREQRCLHILRAMNRARDEILKAKRA